MDNISDDITSRKDKVQLVPVVGTQVFPRSLVLPYKQDCHKS